jgi:hypothetical protein
MRWGRERADEAKSALKANKQRRRAVFVSYSLYFTYVKTLKKIDLKTINFLVNTQ